MSGSPVHPGWQVLLVTVASLLCACLEPIDLSGKRCPCTTGYTCDKARDRCISEACTAAVQVRDFKAEWATPNVIRWSWLPEGDREALVRYEIRVAEKAEDLDSDKALTFGPDQNPELGFFVRQRTGSVNDVLTTTETKGLPADRAWVGQMLAFDSRLCVFRSDVTSRRTLSEPPAQAVVFDDQLTIPTYPASFAPEPDLDGGTGRHLAWYADRDAECNQLGRDPCGQNLKIMTGPSSLRAMAPGAFATAILEFNLTNEGLAHANYARTWLAVNRAGGCVAFMLEPFTIPRASSHTYQVPLRVLTGWSPSQTLLTHADLFSADGGVNICQFNVGGEAFARRQPDGGLAAVRVDQVRIRF